MSCCAIARNVVDATNACRMRRTRGDIGWRLRLAGCSVGGFFACSSLMLSQTSLSFSW